MRSLALAILFFLLQGTANQAQGQAILPPDPSAVGGGNPLQGLGRPDDPSPARYSQSGSSSSQSSSGSGLGSPLGGDGAGLGTTIDGAGLGDGGGLGSTINSESLGGNGGADGGAATTGDGRGGGGSAGDSGVDFSGATAGEGLNLGGDAGVAGDAGAASGAGSQDRAGDAGLGGGNASPGWNDENKGLPPEPNGSASAAGSNAAGGYGTASQSTSKGKPSTTSSTKTGTESSGSHSGSSKSSGTSAAARLNLLESGGKKGQIGLAPNLRNSAPKDLHELTDRLRQAMEKSAHSKPAKETVEKKTVLVPPPPPTVPSSGTAIVDTPSRRALVLLRQGNLAEAETRFRDIVGETPDDLHSQYLLAVTLVLRKKYDEARTTYKYVLNHSKNPKLIELAETGLKKLD